MAATLLALKDARSGPCGKHSGVLTTDLDQLIGRRLEGFRMIGVGSTDTGLFLARTARRPGRGGPGSAHPHQHPGWSGRGASFFQLPSRWIGLLPRCSPTGPRSWPSRAHPSRSNWRRGSFWIAWWAGTIRRIPSPPG